MPDRFKLEVCIDTAQGLAACQTGVDTIELCSALAVGGLTPSAGLIRLARSSSVPVHAMIRPRAGDFLYSSQEIEVALGDIAQAKAAGLAGVVIGASTVDGALDLNVLRQMRDAASGMRCTLHRVIDTLEDPIVALDQVIDLGFTRVLTSGGAPKAIDGVDRLRALIEAAGDRIEIIVGSGVNAANVRSLVAQTGAYSFHTSCSRAVAQDEITKNFGFAPSHMNKTDEATIAEIRRLLESVD